MANYVNPADLILPYLQPLVGSVNTGIEQGIKLGTLQQMMNKEKMLEPYYKARTGLYSAQAAEKELQEKRFNEALGRMGAAPGGTAIPGADTGSITPQQALDYTLLGLKNWDKLLPTDHPVPEAGGVMRTTRGGESSFIPTSGLLPKQKYEAVVSGEETIPTLMDYAGRTSPVMLPRTVAPAEMTEATPAPDFLFGKGIPTMGEPEITGQVTPAIPGPRSAPKAPAAKPYMDARGRIILIDTNSPDAQTTISAGKLVPYSKPEKPEKPEYSPKQALSRISTIDATIARMKSSGTVDMAMAIQNPMLAMLVDTKDPEAVKQAIASLESEREYVSQFAPKSIPQPKKEVPKPLDQKTAVEILKEARGDKNKAREIARKRGYAF